MTKAISLSEEAYQSLKRLKKKDESFSDVVLKLTEGGAPKSLLDFAGTWCGNDIEVIFEKVLKDREAPSVRAC